MQRPLRTVTEYFYTGGLFVLLFLYFLIFNRYHILYLEQNQLFRLNMSFIRDFLIVPGGLPLMAGGFFTQFFIWPWAGALIITLNSLSVYLLLRYIFRKYEVHNVLLSLIPVWLLTIMQSSELFTFDQSFGFLTLLLVFALYISFDSQKSRYLTFFIGWPFFYYLTGGFSMIGILMCATHELLTGSRSKHFIYIFLYIFTGLSVPLLFSRFLFYMPAGKIFTSPLLYDFRIFLLIGLIFLYSWVPLVSLSGSLLRKRDSLGTQFLRKPVLRYVSGILVIFVMGLIVYKYAWSKKAELMLGIDHHIRESQWNEALELVDRYPDLNLLVIYYTNLALLNSGQLGEKMFNYPQIGPQGLRLKWERTASSLTFGGEIFYSLSYNNEAYRWAFEAMVAKGPNPRSLKRLIITSLINGHYKLAEKYLNILGQAPFYRKWVKKYKPCIGDPHLLQKDPEILEKRELLINNDFISNAHDLNLDDLLKNYPENKMAFEYYIASLLLNKDLDTFSENIVRIKDFGYSKLPRYFEEALVFYNFYERKNIIPEGFSINPATIERFNDYATTYTKFRSDRPVAANQLRKKHEKTYWYYLQFYETHMY